MKVKVREAVPEDTGTIAEYNLAMARETEDKELDSDTLFEGVAAGIADPARGTYYVAEVDGKLAACLLVTHEWSDWRNGWFWWIQSVYVAPDYRRRGLYSRMYKAVKSYAKEADRVVGFRLYVERENRRAQQTYESLGMSESGYLMFEELTSG
ncbi:MAG: GNAT family N-acetyltransferase [Pseudomonadota bacterium]